MLQPKMIELENQINCSQKHNLPILMVIFDKKLKREEHLLCAQCMENFESESKMIGFKKTLKMMEEHQKTKLENIERIIKLNQDMVESLINQIHKLKSDLNQQLDELISNSIDWIKSLNNIGQANTTYSFLDELEALINRPKENIFNQESIIDQIKLNNDSLSAKIKIKLSNLQNQDLYKQCEKTLGNINLFPHVKSLENSIDYQDECCALSFNESGTLMISGCNCEIKVWNFQNGILNQITTLSGHKWMITCLIFSKKSNSFLSASYDQTICLWMSSQFYQKHTNCIDCLILNQTENQLISGGRDFSIKVWKVDFQKNQLSYLYSLDKHKNDIYSLGLNQSENTLVSFDLNEIIIWKKDNQQNWYFENLVTLEIQSLGSRLSFINDHQFILGTGNEEEDLISLFELQNEKNLQLQIIEELKLFNSDGIDANLFPICYNKEKKIMIFKQKLHVYIIQISNEDKLFNIIYYWNINKGWKLFNNLGRYWKEV
ncbi:unnamed protein product [Paramecium octaurelia]|uniref:Uncharacterized protein n=1 Tax=Paramecium octaurelia TaxID=43137 RepID=A0A8S1WT46_PAROT|nr:unnamed protein product [Paramecium octaurelia]